MSSWSRLQALLLIIREAILDAVHSDRAGDDRLRRAFQEEAAESNAHTVRWLVPFLGPMHAIVIGVLLSSHETSAPRVSWLSWLVAINAIILGCGIVASFVAWRRRSSAIYAVLGDIGGVIYLLGAAAMTANAQRAYPNLNIFLVTALFTAIRLRMRPAVYVASLLASVSLVLLAMARFRSGGVLRTADYLTLLSISSISGVTFLLTRRMCFRELRARFQVEHLNAQLNEKIRERSRELTMALACLAEGHRELAPGTVLGGRAELEAPIGCGGMGMVYRGRDLLTGDAVAIKIVQAGSALELDGLYRFLREAQIVASVTHPAIVRSIHVDVSDDGRLFQMMELVDGETLEMCLARTGALPPFVAARLGAVLADALATAHLARVVHLDVKPANVMLTRSKPGLKLLDFGISRLRGGRAVRGSTDSILGTPEFLSPEHLNAPQRVDDRADVYALGLVLYLAIAGRMPFDATTSPEWFFAHALHAPRDLGESAPGIDPDLAQIVMHCLRKDPSERPAASVVATALGALADLASVPPLEALDLLAPKVPSARTIALTVAGATPTVGRTQRSSAAPAASPVDA